MESSGTDLGTVKGMIRHRDSEKYYIGQGQWGAKMRDAWRFNNMEEAVEEARRAGLNGPCEYVVEIRGQIGFRVFLSF